MNGDEKVRHCDNCQLNVYNLSAMTRWDAERLLLESEGRLCVRFYRRADGTIITQNCPRGVAALKRRLSRAATAVFTAVLTFLSGVGINTAVSLAQRGKELQGRMAIPSKTTKPQNKTVIPQNKTVFRQPNVEIMGGLRADFQDVQRVIKPQKKFHSIKPVK